MSLPDSDPLASGGNHRPLGDPAFDRDLLLDSVDGDLTLLRRAIHLFANSDGPRLILALSQAAKNRDALGVESAAHSLTGLLGELRAGRAFELARSLETMGRSGRLEEVDARTAELLSEIERLRAQLFLYAGLPDTGPITTLPRKGLVLVTEDVQVIAEKMAATLRRGGYDVVLAEDGAQCLELARSLLPGLIILDIMMPKIHGIDVMKQLRSVPETQNIGVIVCTAKSFGTEYSEVSELGAFDFLVKPCEPLVLIKAVDRFFVNRANPERRLPPRETGSAEGDAFRPSLQTHHGCLTLWGTRGSTPTPGAAFLRHGGQTSCMVITRGTTVCIFDSGSGIRDFGPHLLKSGIRTAHLFITHTHWDHIQGFPFFIPAYVPGFKINVYGARGFGKDLKSVFSGQLDRDYFPVQLEEMKAELNFVHLTQEPVELEGAKVTWEFSNHPGATVGYKIDLGGVKVAWVPDNEFLQGYIGSPDMISREDERVAPYHKMIDFLTRVDLLIHEAQYTNEEYPKKIGWGHTGLSNACLLAKLARVRRWIVTHHDPSHDDPFLESKLNLTRQLLDRSGHPIPVAHGYDGLTEYL